MNGVHDMGGMQGMGPIRYEKNEPVFHAPWEARVYALNRAMRAWRKWNLDSWRYDIEELPAADYLRMSYYEKWLTVLEKQVVTYGLVSKEEMASGKAAAGAPRATPALTPDAARRLSRGIPSSSDSSVAPMFQAGQNVRARNINTSGHTRLPRYVRGKSGKVIRDHGVYSFPDTNARFQGEHRQHVYSVRFAARELWGEQASSRDFVHLDMWDDYLEHA
jgi:nitrile hydratase beta subunit